ncbi:hypothetical protein OQA88_5025 [Cercophora sp. LCS_1]
MASSSSPTKRLTLLPPPPQPPRSPSPSPLSPRPPPPLHLTIRFSTSLPDLHLDILHPDTTTIATLKSLIRPRLPSPASTSRLRFIHSGKILPPSSTLSSVLKPLPPPPPSSSSANGKGKGKQPEGNPPPQRVYINCSIGDVLTQDELEEEEQSAAVPAAAPTQPAQVRDAGVRRRENVPRGFERLLSAGFTPAEVGQLRLQFRGIQAARHTPDTMPSPDTLRGMEDAWIDDNRGAGTGGGQGMGMEEEGGGQGGGGGDEFGLNAVVDAMIKGMFLGFVFPLGAVGWLLREEGIWPKRVQVFVSLGFLLSLSVGVVRALGGEG